MTYLVHPFFFLVQMALGQLQKTCKYKMIVRHLKHCIQNTLSSHFKLQHTKKKNSMDQKMQNIHKYTLINHRNIYDGKQMASKSITL